MTAEKSREHNSRHSGLGPATLGGVTSMTSESQNRLKRLLGYVQQDPGNIRLLMEALSLAVDSGDVQHGLYLIEHMENHSIKEPQLYAHAVYSLLQAGEYAKAAEYGEFALAAGMSPQSVIYNVAYAHFSLAAYDIAASRLEQLTKDPACTMEALLLHVRALDHLERNDEAESLAARAVTQEPDNAEALGLMALQQFENGDNAGALRSAYEALTRAPTQLDALVACASAHFEQGSMEAARKTWLHTVEAYPSCGRAWSGVALIEFNELEFDHAVEHLNLAVHYMPDHIGTWHVLAWIHILRADATLARAALTKAHALDRNYSETHGGIAACDVLEGKLEEARQGIRRALRLDPDCRSACYAQMLLLRGEGKQAQGDQVFRDMLARIAPSGADTGLALAEKWQLRQQSKQRQTPPGQH